MEDSMGMSPLGPQNYLFGHGLKVDIDYYFKVDNGENEHQLSLRTVSLGAKDELCIVEAEAMNYEGNTIKVTLATLKMSVQPTVSLGGFEITPPVVLWPRCGSGPMHISRQHLVAVEEDAESEDEDEEDVKVLSMTGKPSAPRGGNKIPQKKVKVDEDEEEDEDDDEDDFDDEETEEKVPVKKSLKSPSKNRRNS
ncbi:nucleophosmin-like [Phodopus roborovskii]|uniref:nucleophosmin-like n=1 Tax=Phodopus roborovskii TaxID=109678 RepID=UPI0021E4930C|nr:nucleophosmin-like [Phodopus roborovskii]